MKMITFSKVKLIFLFTNVNRHQSLPLMEIKRIEVKYNDIIYALNKEEKTSSIIDGRAAKGEIMIPLEIIYENEKYPVTRICANSFNKTTYLDSIDFPTDSQLQVIEKGSFKYSRIRYIYIPSSVEELIDGWCKETPDLNEFEVESTNNKYFNYEDNFILTKSDMKSDIYDTLVFSRRDIKTIEIPSFIKIIGPYSFEHCVLNEVTFPDNSELQKIEKKAFRLTSFTKINIPSHVTFIGNNSFAETQLNEINFCENSELQIIDKKAFSNSSLTSIKIPKSVEELRDGWCHDLEDLYSCEIIPISKRFSNYGDKIVVGKSDPKSDIYDTIVFACRDIEKVKIPAYIKFIAPYAFDKCTELTEIEFAKNSKLISIGEQSFSETSFQKIIIPPHVTIIHKNAFSYTAIKTAEFAENAEIQIIGKKAFKSSYIEYIEIPSSIIEIQNKWCQNTPNLIKFKIHPNNKFYINYENDFILGKSDPKSDIYDILEFARRDIEVAKIPNYIKQLSKYSFEECSKLTKIEFLNDSKIQLFDVGAFEFTAIKEFVFPANLSEIKESAFEGCDELDLIIFPSNSKLAVIGEKAFVATKFKSVSIPSSVNKIEPHAFHYNVLLVEICENSELKSINKSTFGGNKELVIMAPHKNEINFL